jgi:hypothetical protein
MFLANSRWNTACRAKLQASEDPRIFPAQKKSYLETWPNFLIFLARPAGFEPTTPWFVGPSSECHLLIIYQYVECILAGARVLSRFRTVSPRPLSRAMNDACAHPSEILCRHLSDADVASVMTTTLPFMSLKVVQRNVGAQESMAVGS